MLHLRNRVVRGVAFAVPVFLTASGIALWRSARVADAAPIGASPVAAVRPGQHLGDDPGEKGATYYALEAQTVKFVSDFADGSRAVAERGIDGAIAATLTDAQGIERGRFRARAVSGGGDILVYSRTGDDPVLARADAGRRSTLDWANQQLFALNRDGVAAGTSLVWQNGLMRRSSAPDAIGDAAIATVETDWANGLTARTTRVRSKKGDTMRGRPVQGDVLVTEVRRDGALVGTANYLTHERVFTFKVNGGRGGLIAPEHLQAKYGGWPFTPDMTWMNIQALALTHWQAAINDTGFVARAGACRPAPTMVGRVLQAFAPVVEANEPGCDGLHWLDGTVYRYCCDVHDYCYSKNGCSSSSWWQFWSSWTCTACNTWVVGCFADAGFDGPFYRF